MTLIRKINRRGNLVAGILFLLLVARVAFGSASVLPELFGPLGVQPQAVRQGSLGSCYFHSAIAAIAATNPDSLQKSIEPLKQTQWRVTFADGKIENVYVDDVRYARDSGFDRSDGLWVSVLFRAYAQRTIRSALLDAINSSELPLIIRANGASFFSSNDLVMLAYDRAVRAAVSQEGDIDRKLLSRNLDKEMATVSISADTRKLVLHMLESKGYFDALASKVKNNGELFGAYRAVGQGGLPEEVLAAFTGKSSGANVNADIATTLVRAQRSHLAITASTGDSIGRKLPVTAGGTDWFVASHAYTILNFDPGQKTVTLRNPWGDHPDPGGVFTIPLETFVSAYERIAVGENSR
jgi:hypothetical protein